ncbi:MAG: MFS transporter [Rectinemataceae bacterium]|jgi:FSR family fosmidomycin resistance protein-like MFS transporter
MVPRLAGATVFPILIAISISHLLNDTLQSLVPAIYPLIKTYFHLSYAQVGLITFTNQVTASLFQPVVGSITDRRPQPYSLACGMVFTLIGLILLSRTQSFGVLLLSVSLIGMGSSIFHPESSRVANMAAGEKRGLAQSIFQVGGNAGSALGPLLAAAVISVRGRWSVIWFTPLALVAIVVLSGIGRWYAGTIAAKAKRVAVRTRDHLPSVSGTKLYVSVIILLVLIFSKYFYLAGMNSYFTFYLIDRFSLSVRSAQLHLFIFQFAVAAGTLIGGPVGDRFGRKYVIWISILGVSPFTMALPYMNLAGTTVLSVIIGLILASAFSAILVYAQELLPGRLGLISGLFFGFAFGMGGIGSAVLGSIADHSGIQHVYRLCAFLPLLGLITGLLPNIESGRRRGHK